MSLHLHVVHTYLFQAWLPNFPFLLPTYILYGHQKAHVMCLFIFMLSMLNCDQLCYYVKLLTYKNVHNHF
jgi:hypothetical protein